MSIVESNVADAEWERSIENLSAIGTSMDNLFFQKAISRLESFWEERVEKDTATATLLSALGRALMTFSATKAIEPTFVELLPTVLFVSDSPFGFLAEVRYNTVGDPYLFSHAVTNIYKPSFGQDDIVSGLQFHNLETLNGAIMTGRRPVVTNDPKNDPRSGGLPFGHAGLEAFLGLPFLVADELVGAASLGDRPGGYAEAEVRLLTPLCEIGGLMIAASRLDE